MSVNSHHRHQSSSSSSSQPIAAMVVLCRCRKPTIIMTSWTDRNPGRRYYGCNQVYNNCGHNGWFDPPMCKRAVEIIPGLLRARNRLEEEINARVKEAKEAQQALEEAINARAKEAKEAAMWKNYLFRSWILFGIFVYLFGWK